SRGRPRSLPVPGTSAPAVGPDGWKMNPAPPPPGQQVIHVTQDLDTELEALFNAVMNPKPSSWRKKILPESFFQEPDSGAHSRQSSTDSGAPPPRPAQHVRSHSSPASLLGAGAAPQHAHLRQRSYDVTDELPLPPGWEMALTHTGQRYFLNHIEKITTWQDPRKALTQPLNHMSHHPAGSSPAVPQRPMAMAQPLAQPVAQPSLGDAVVVNQRGVLCFAGLGQQQLGGSAVGPQSRPPQPGLLPLPSALTAQQQQQQKLRLQRIQMERERIRMRQEELLRQEAALCRQLPMDSDGMGPVQSAVNAPALAQDMRPVTNNGSDPFLNRQVHGLFFGHSVLGPYHSREQSTDSGLGLGCYSIPTTPEDFLSNVDEMDTGETIAQTTMNVNPQQTRFPDFLDCLPGTNVDLGTLESEDLIPILNDVESVLNKSEPFLTWL
ncbi:WWTR1 protein, partial [Alopecoenas beccarii]|nr:WWTR1 protein [Alopecoenas beccarii]